MDIFKQFIISFTGLKTGLHQYEFNIDDWFFEKFDYSEIKKGRININLTLDKHENIFVFEFRIKGNINIICDRCLDYFDYPIESNERLIVKFGEEKNEITEEILIIPETENQIDISHYIYEFINLSLPIRCVHPSDENGLNKCDKDVIKKMEESMTGDNIDPRWETLKLYNYN